MLRVSPLAREEELVLASLPSLPGKDDLFSRPVTGLLTERVLVGSDAADMVDKKLEGRRYCLLLATVSHVCQLSKQSIVYEQDEYYLWQLAGFGFGLMFHIWSKGVYSAPV
jgi:hypothetical protein